MAGEEKPLLVEWAWPSGAVVVAVLTIVWMLFGAGGWFWMLLAFGAGAYIAWRSWTPRRRLI